MRCPAPDVLDSFARGLSPTVETPAIEEHVASCVLCRARVDPNGRVDRASMLASPPPQIGRYVVGERLGTGGMGIVYRAHDPVLGRPVAIKLLKRPVAAAEDREELLREARAMAQLAHPNVVVILDVGSVDDRTYLAMELVEGTTLGRWRSERAGGWREVVALLTQAGRGLAAAHSVGIIHRDFKPDNVLIGGDGRARVTDFGLARGASVPPSARTGAPAPEGGDASHVERFVGTPRYMAPEQLEGRTDARSDQFSFCVTFWETLYGQRPFDDDVPSIDGRRAILRAGRVRAPPSRRVPGWLRALVLRGLRFDPAERFASMDALLLELARAPRRRRFAVGGAAALGLVLTGALTAAAWGHHEPPPCAGGPARTATVWGDETRARVASAFTATGAPYAEAARTQALRALDAYVADWQRQYVDACQATRVRGDQSEELLDRKMSCLGDRLTEVGALADRFSHADAPTVEKAAGAVEALAPLSRCANGAALSGQVAASPLARDAIAVARARLAELKALRDTGAWVAASERADAALDAARATAWPPIVGEAQLLSAQIGLDLRPDDRADETLRQAAASAEVGRADGLRAAVWIEMVRADVERTRLARAHEDGALAAAILPRLGSDGDPLRAALAAREGDAYYADNDFTQALARYQEARVLHERLGGENRAELATDWNWIGRLLDLLNRSEEAGVALQKALAMREAVLGPHHPLVAETLRNVAFNTFSTSHPLDAEPFVTRAVAIVLETSGPESVQTHNILQAKGAFLATVGRFDEALVVSRRVVELSDRLRHGDHIGTANDLFNLAQIELNLERWDDAAAHCQRAIDMSLRIHGSRNAQLAGQYDELAAARAGQRRYAEAHRAIDAALAIFAALDTPDHVGRSSTLLNLGDLLVVEKKMAPALEAYQASLVEEEHDRPPTHADLAYPLTGMGRAGLALGRNEEARAWLERALSIREPHPETPASALAMTRLSLARALWATNGDRTRARSLAAAACPGLVETPADHRDCELWVRSHP